MVLRNLQVLKKACDLKATPVPCRKALTTILMMTAMRVIRTAAKQKAG